MKPRTACADESYACVFVGVWACAQVPVSIACAIFIFLWIRECGVPVCVRGH